MSESSLNNLNSQNYFYGSTPNIPVAEQNQTYFAYFDGVGGTGPEVIDQTAYFVKYLIDTEGNIVNPEPDVVTNRPQAIGLYNLVNNFEIGKNAVVKLIESDPTLPESINGDTFDNALTGIYPITYVGRIATLMTTEFGQSNNDYIATMSFQEYQTYIQQEDIPNFSFNAWAGGNIGIPLTNNPQPTDQLYLFETIQSNELGYFDGNTYTFGDTTSNYGLALSFEASFNTALLGAFNNTYGYTFSYWIELSENGGATWNRLPIEIYPFIGGSSISANNNPGTISPNGTVYNHVSNAGTNGSNINVSFYHNVRSIPRSFQIGDRVRVKYTITRYAPAAGTFANSTVVIYGAPSTAGGTSFKLVSDNGYSNLVTSSYFVDISPPSTTYPLQTQFLTASSTFSSLLNNNFVQIIDTASIAQGFSQPTFPANIQPGDKIRFEYNPNQVSTIINVLATDETPSRICLELFPAIIPDGVVLDHFVIYRIIDDGTYIVLNVPKPILGKNFSGIIQPEFISQQLFNNYDRIIVNLTEREIIN